MSEIESRLKQDLGAVRFAWWSSWTRLGLAILQGGRFSRQFGLAALYVGKLCRLGS